MDSFITSCTFCTSSVISFVCQSAHSTGLYSSRKARFVSVCVYVCVCVCVAAAFAFMLTVNAANDEHFKNLDHKTVESNLRFVYMMYIICTMP